MDEFEKLKQEYAKLRELLLPREDGTYSWKQFLVELIAKRGCVYGWRDAYIAATRKEGFQPVTMTETKQWGWGDSVPAYAFEQISRMDLDIPKKRRFAHRKWTDAEDNYLIALYQKNPLETDSYFARMCTQHFHRNLTVNSIKGKLYRLRRRTHVIKRDAAMEWQEKAIAA